jgi:hypothetical protein
MADERAAALAEFSQAIAGEILTMPVLADPEWDTYALAADVSDEATKLTAYRYTEGGPPVPTPYPMAFDLFQDLRERTRGNDGERWDIAVVRIHRDTAQLVVNFVAGDAAEMWRISPANIDNLPELLRPRPEDFAAV